MILSQHCSRRSLNPSLLAEPGSDKESRVAQVQQYSLAGPPQAAVTIIADDLRKQEKCYDES